MPFFIPVFRGCTCDVKPERPCCRFSHNQINGTPFVGVGLLRHDWQLQHDVERAEQKVELRLNFKAVCGARVHHSWTWRSSHHYQQEIVCARCEEHTQEDRFLKLFKKKKREAAEKVYVVSWFPMIPTPDVHHVLQKTLHNERNLKRAWWFESFSSSNII